jgi:hypothetical protein
VGLGVSSERFVGLSVRPPWQNGGPNGAGGVHNFGLTYGFSNVTVTVNSSGDTVTLSSPNGYPNP